MKGGLSINGEVMVGMSVDGGGGGGGGWRQRLWRGRGGRGWMCIIMSDLIVRGTVQRSEGIVK